MTSSDSPDQSANEDDAIWLDLVARLQGNTPPANSPASGTADAHRDPEEPAGAPGQNGGANGPGRPASFRDFDPLGLARAAPTELSAAERLGSAPGSADGGQAQSGGAGSGHGKETFSPGGPRDYGVAEDDGNFVPEDPPSLAGTEPLTMLAWLGAVGGPVALVLSTMFWRSAPIMATLGMLVAFVLAVVYLIMKLPQEKDENDDGARV